MSPLRAPISAAPFESQRLYHEKDLVLHIFITMEVQMRNLFTKALPLGLLASWIILIICIVGFVDQTEIRDGLQLNQRADFVAEIRFWYVVKF